MMMNRNMQFGNRQKGFNLLELVITLGLISLGIAGVVMLYTRGTDSSEMNNFSTDFIALLEGAKRTTGSWQTYNGLNDQVLKANNAVPQRLTDGNPANGTIRHPWSGGADGITFTAVNGDTQFTIAVSLLDDDKCNQIVNSMNPSTTNFDALDINGNAYANNGSAAAFCTAGAGANVITYTSS